MISIQLCYFYSVVSPINSYLQWYTFLNFSPNTCSYARCPSIFRRSVDGTPSKRLSKDDIGTPMQVEHVYHATPQTGEREMDNIFAFYRIDVVFGIMISLAFVKLCSFDLVILSFHIRAILHFLPFRFYSLFFFFLSFLLLTHLPRHLRTHHLRFCPLSLHTQPTPCRRLPR